MARFDRFILAIILLIQLVIAYFAENKSIMKRTLSTLILILCTWSIISADTNSQQEQPKLEREIILRREVTPIKSNRCPTLPIYGYYDGSILTNY